MTLEAIALIAGMSSSAAETMGKCNCGSSVTREKCWPPARALDRRLPAGFGRRQIARLAGLLKTAANEPFSSARLERLL